MEEIEFSWWLFEGRLRQGKNVLPDGLNWLCYFAGSSKSHRENSISFIVFHLVYHKLLKDCFSRDMKRANNLKNKPSKSCDAKKSVVKHFQNIMQLLNIIQYSSSRLGIYKFVNQQEF